MIKEIQVVDVTGALTKIGALSADVGRVTDGVGVRLLHKEETVHYRQIRYEENELTRMWAIYPRNE
ncbi:MAG: hypothetical protein IMF18_02240 [Proteobacteria bacterium]|nr:hypothetical protein [Pseudomonadota bacterium]